MKKLICIILSVVLVLGCVSFGTFAAEDKINIIINGDKKEFDVMPVMRSDRVLVPMRGIFESLGAEVGWDDATKTATGSLGDKSVKITIGKTEAYTSSGAITLDVPAQIIDSRTMVPVRFVSEALGAEVAWEGDTRSVIITMGEEKVYDFDSLSTLVLNTDFITGAGYNSANVSLSSDVDHTTGSGKSVYMQNREKADHRIKLADVFSADDLNKIFDITAWVYIPETSVAGTVKMSTYGDGGTDHAWTPDDYSLTYVKTGEWTKVSLEAIIDFDDITQLGFEQQGGDIITEMYIDDITVSQKLSPDPTPTPIVITDGRRNVPTEFEKSSDPGDLIYYEDISVSNQEALAKLGEGTVIIEEDALFEAAFSNGSGAAVIDYPKVKNMPFKNSAEVSVSKLPSAVYATALRFGYPLEGKAEPGDMLLAHIWLRSKSEGEGRLDVIIEDKDVYTKCLVGSAVAGSEWTEFYFPCVFEANHVSVSIRFGHGIQDIEFGGFTLTNYGSDVTFDDMPRSDSTPYLKEDAEWRAEAMARIEQIRKGDVTVKVVDTNGNPIENAKVDVNMYEHEFEWGAMVESDEVTNSASKFSQALHSNFNSAVIGNSLKWAIYENDTTRGHKLYNAIKALGIRDIRGHCLLWDRARKDGAFLSSVPYGLEDLYDDKAALQNRIRTHINKITSEYKDKLVDWDVLNEAVANTVIQDIYGREIVTEWFDMARAADSGATLYYNDYIMNETLFELLDEFEELGVDYDGIGIQSHYSNAMNPEEIYEFYDRLAGYGKRLKVTEYDFGTADDELQAEFTRDLMIISFSHEMMDGFYMWVWQGGDNNRGALYDGAWNEKPGLKQYQDLIYNKWWTRESGVTDKDGTYSLRAYYGDYDVTVTVNGVTKTIQESFYKGEDNTLTVVIGDIYGDATGDNKVNALDRAAISRHVAKWSGYTELINS